MAQQLVNGALPLAAQQDTLNFIEQAAFAKIVAYGATMNCSAPMNQATVEDVPIGKQLAALHLITVGAQDDAAVVIASQMTTGRTLAFEGDAFIAGAQTKVLAFR